MLRSVPRGFSEGGSSVSKGVILSVASPRSELYRQSFVAARHLGVSEQTYYRWRKEYGGMEVTQVHRLKELEQENGRLKRLVADQALDNLILKEAARGNF